MMTFKTLTGLVVTSLLTIQAMAQVIYERTYPFAFPSMQHPIEFPDGSTFTLGEGSDCGGIGSRHIDAAGNELVDNVFGAEVFSSGYHWIGHDSVLIWAEEGALDAGRDSFRVYVWTPDSLHKLLSIGIREVPWDLHKYGAYLYATNSLVYNRFETFYTYDLITGVVEDSLMVPGADRVFEFDGSILITSVSSYPILINPQLDIIQIWPDLAFLPFQMNEALVLDSFLLGRVLTDSLAIGMFNVYTEVYKVVDVSPYLDKIIDIQINSGYLFVRGMSDMEDVVLQLDKTGSMTDLIPLDIPDAGSEWIYTYFPERVFAWRFDGLADYKANYRICYSYPDPNPIRYVDIAWDTIWVDSIFKHPPEWHVPATVFVSAVVNNLSPDTLTSLTLHFQDIPQFWCDNGVYPRHLDQLNILPFAADTIHFGTWSYSAAQDLPFNRTFFIQHGNEHLDANTDDNVITLNYLISSSKDIAPYSFSVSPNPFTNHLHISDLSESTQLILYDQTSRRVAQGYSQLDNLGHLSPGMYILQVIKGHSSGVTKVIKMD